MDMYGCLFHQKWYLHSHLDPSPWALIRNSRQVLSHRTSQPPNLWSSCSFFLPGQPKGLHKGDPSVCFPSWLVVEPYPSEKWWSSSVGMMTFPIYGKLKAMFQTTNQCFFPFKICWHEIMQGKSTSRWVSETKLSSICPSQTCSLKCCNGLGYMVELWLEFLWHSVIQCWKRTKPGNGEIYPNCNGFNKSLGRCECPVTSWEILQIHPAKLWELQDNPEFALASLGSMRMIRMQKRGQEQTSKEQ